MKFLFLAENDFAGCGACFAAALRTQGHQVDVCVGNVHMFRYPYQHDPHPNADQLLDYDVVQIIHTSDYISYQYGYDWLHQVAAKNLFVHHGGSKYRNNPREWNEHWNPKVRATIIPEADLLGLGAKNEEFIVYACDTERIRGYRKRMGAKGTRTPEGNHRLRVGHFPSSPQTKGSPRINQTLARYHLNRVIDYSTSVDEYGEKANRVLWPDQLERMSKCDVIVDQIQAEIKGKPFGEWAALTQEAAALGCIPIANSLKVDRYVQEYGRLPAFRIVNHPDQLAPEIDLLVRMPPEEIEHLKEEAAAWVLAYHGLEATGKRLAEFYEKYME